MARKPAAAAAPSPTGSGAAGNDQAAALAAQAEKDAADLSKAWDEASKENKERDKKAKEAKERELADDQAKADEEAKAKEAQGKAAGLTAADAEAAGDDSWSLPVVTEFPVTLVLINASPSRRDCHSIGLHLAPGEEREFEFTDVTFEKFARYITQIALLNGWKAGGGLLIEQGAEDGKN